jgi:hypothetical protein
MAGQGPDADLVGYVERERAERDAVDVNDLLDRALGEAGARTPVDLAGGS